MARATEAAAEKVTAEVVAAVTAEVVEIAEVVASVSSISLIQFTDRHSSSSHCSKAQVVVEAASARVAAYAREVDHRAAGRRVVDNREVGNKAAASARVAAAEGRAARAVDLVEAAA